MVRIRPATEHDLPAMANPAALADRESPVSKAWRRVGAGEAAMLVAEAGGRYAGRIWVDLARTRPYLYSLGVVEGLRNAGIGTALIEAAEAVAAERGALETEIAANLDNERAQRLYERLGYAPVTTFTDTWFDVQPDGTRIPVFEACRLLRKRLTAR